MKHAVTATVALLSALLGVFIGVTFFAPEQPDSQREPGADAREFPAVTSERAKPERTGPSEGPEAGEGQMEARGDGRRPPTPQELQELEQRTRTELNSFLDTQLARVGPDEVLAQQTRDDFEAWELGEGSRLESVECATAVGCRVVFAHLAPEAAEKVRGAGYQLFRWAEASYTDARAPDSTVLYPFYARADVEDFMQQRSRPSGI